MVLNVLQWHAWNWKSNLGDKKDLEHMEVFCIESVNRAKSELARCNHVTQEACHRGRRATHGHRL